jgi:hypothetical protein
VASFSTLREDVAHLIVWSIYQNCGGGSSAIIRSSSLGRLAEDLGQSVEARTL